MFYNERYLRKGGRFNGVWKAAHEIPIESASEEDSLNDVCRGTDASAKYARHVTPLNLNSDSPYKESLGTVVARFIHQKFSQLTDSELYLQYLDSADLMQLMNPSEYAKRKGQTLSLRFASTLVAGVAQRHAQLADDLLRDTMSLLNYMEIRHPDLHSLNSSTMSQESEEESGCSAQNRAPLNRAIASTIENRPETSSIETNGEENCSTENNEEEEDDDESDGSDGDDDDGGDTNKGDHSNGGNNKSTNQSGNTHENTSRSTETEKRISSMENPPNTPPLIESRVTSPSAYTRIRSSIQEISRALEQDENVAPCDDSTTHEVDEGAANRSGSPVLRSGVVTPNFSDGNSPILRNICYNKRKIPLNQYTPSKKNRRDEVIMEMPLDLSMKPRVLEEQRPNVMDLNPCHYERPDVTLHHRSPVSLRVGAEDVQSPACNTNTASAIDDQVENPALTDEEMEVDNHSWETMTDQLSESFCGPAEASEPAPEVSLPPGTRGVPTAPATRRRRVRRPPLVYRARKLRSTSQETTTIRSITTPTKSPEADQQSFTQHVEDQDMRGNNVSLLNISITEDTNQLVRLANANTITPPPVHQDVITAHSPNSQPRFRERVTRASQEFIEFIADTSRPHLDIPVPSCVSPCSDEEVAIQTIHVSADIHPEPRETVSQTSPAQSPESVSNSTTGESKTSVHTSSTSQTTVSEDQNEPDSTEMIEENYPEYEEEAEETREPAARNFLSVILEVTEPSESTKRSLEETTTEIEENDEEGDDPTRATESATIVDVPENTNTEESSLILRDSSPDHSTDHVDVSRPNEILDDIQICEELNDSGEENESIQNVVSDGESVTSETSQSSLGLDCISYIYKRSDSSRALIMRNKVSEDPELNREIWTKWRSTFE